MNSSTGNEALTVTRQTFTDPTGSTSFDAGAAGRSRTDRARGADGPGEGAPSRGRQTPGAGSSSGARWPTGGGQPPPDDRASAVERLPSGDRLPSGARPANGQTLAKRLATTGSLSLRLCTRGR